MPLQQWQKIQKMLWKIKMSVPSKAKAVKLDNPAQAKVIHQSETELHRLGGNK